MSRAPDQVTPNPCAPPSQVDERSLSNNPLCTDTKVVMGAVMVAFSAGSTDGTGQLCRSLSRPKADSAPPTSRQATAPESAVYSPTSPVPTSDSSAANAPPFGGGAHSTGGCVPSSFSQLGVGSLALAANPFSSANKLRST